MAFPRVTMDEWNIIAIKLSVSVCCDSFWCFVCMVPGIIQKLRPLGGEVRNLATLNGTIQEQNCMATSNHRSNMAVEIIANGKSNCEAF